ncbi:MAG: DMT family transporter [Oscillospiraceae bacterium]|nr:DMT family transporter [Oscillospiraceae bacterium]
MLHSQAGIERAERRAAPWLHMVPLFLTALIWGLAFVAQVEGTQHMGDLTFGGGRFAIGALSLLPVILLFERKPGGREELRRTLLYGAIGGGVLFIASTLQQYGITLTQSAGKSGFITGLYTVFTPILGIFLGRKTSLTTWLGAAAAVMGLYLLSAPSDMNRFGLGDALLLIGAVFWAAHILVVDRLASRVRPIRFSAVQFTACSLISWAAAIPVDAPRFSQLQAGLLPLLYCGLLSTGVAYTLQIVGQRHVEPTRAAIIFSLETLFSALGGFLFLHEFLGWKGYLGGALMFLGIILSQLKRKEISGQEIRAEKT